MRRFVYDYKGEKLLKVEEAEPECGEDFCDTCGDCLRCYGGEACYVAADGEHWWVVYEEEVPA